MKWLWFQIRWWHWFLSGPNVVRMRLAGSDREGIRIAEERWTEKEPKR